MEDKEYKLNFEFVPDSCWYLNLRNILSKKDWDFLRRDAYARANGKCMICGRKVTRLEAHERWDYDDENHVQILSDIIAVCHSCHEVIHYGRTSIVGNAERAEDHFMKVNKCSYVEMRSELGKATELHRKRNEVSEWKLDLSFLNQYIKK